MTNSTAYVAGLFALSVGAATLVGTHDARAQSFPSAPQPRMTAPNGVVYSSPTNIIWIGPESWRTYGDVFDIDASARGNVRGLELPFGRRWNQRYGPDDVPVAQKLAVAIERFANLTFHFHGTDVTVSASFFGSPTFSATADVVNARSGSLAPVRHTFSSVSPTSSFRIAAFDTVRQLVADATIKVAYGLVRPGTFSVVYEQSNSHIVMTPDGPTPAHATARFDKIHVATQNTAQPADLFLTNPKYTTVTAFAPGPVLPPPAPSPSPSPKPLPVAPPSKVKP